MERDERQTYADYLATRGLDLDALAVEDNGTLVDRTAVARSDFEGRGFGALDIGTGDVAYRLEQTLGVGGMGVVRAATETLLDRPVAIKQLHPRRDGTEAGGELLREAWVTGHLEHPNIVPVHTVGWASDGRPAFVMKRVEGTPWSTLLEHPERVEDVRGAPAPDVLLYHLEVLLQVCHAVGFAHSRGVLHRDIKPSNVMIGRFGEVYLVDWGLAVALPGRELPIRRAVDVHGVEGTPGYLAPEMAAADGTALGPHTDVYLLGATLHHVLTGAPLHDATTLGAQLARAWRPAEHVHLADVPSELARLCASATAPKPADRPRSVEAFRRAVARFIEHRGATLLTMEAWERTRQLQAVLERDSGGQTVDSSVIGALFTEAQFGFEQSLRIWPGNEEARGGLQQILERRASHHLRHGERDAAVALMVRLEPVPPHLRQALADLDRSQQQRDAELAELQEMRQAQRVGVGALQRRAVALLATLGLTSILLLLGGLQRAGLWVPDYPPIVAMVLVYDLALAASVVWAFRSATPNRSALQQTLVFVVSMAFFTSHLLFAWANGIPFLVGYAEAPLVSAAAVAGLGLTVHRRFLPVAVAQAATAAAMAMLPGWIFFVFAAGNLASHTLLMRAFSTFAASETPGSAIGGRTEPPQGRR